MKRSFALTLICLSIQGLVGWSSVLSQDKKSRQGNSDQAGQIETQRDRFSDTTVVKLNMLYLFKKQGHKLAISLEIKVDPKKPDKDAVFANFSSYTQDLYDFGDRELHFLVDGDRVSLGAAKRGIPATFPGSPETLFIGIRLTDLDRIASGKKVEMRLGSIECAISDETLSVLREFVKTAKNSLTTPK
jgi:hypothetical protein